MASMKRKDNKGRLLNTGENQMQSGRYRYQYTDGGGKRHAIYSWRLVKTDSIPAGKRPDACLRDKIRQVQRDLEDGISITDGSKITLNDLFEQYISGKQELKASTRTNYLYMYHHFVSEKLGARKITSIRYSDIKSFYDWLIRERELKLNSAEIIHTILHPMFRMAVRDGYLRSNPTEGVIAELKKSHSWERPKRHALTLEEQTAFIEHTAHSPMYHHWLPLFTVFLGTGCRVGELIGLRWDDCDFEENTISINHNLIYRHQEESGKCEMHITTPKTNAGIRTIPMLGEVRQALLEEEKSHPSTLHTLEIDGYTNFVFLNRNGHVHNPITINKAIKRIYTDYNEQERFRAEREHRPPLFIRHFSAHNLRHTFCTRFCENETNLKVIQEIMGHSDISTTMNIYAEVTEGKKKKTFAQLEGKIKIT